MLTCEKSGASVLGKGHWGQATSTGNSPVWSDAELLVAIAATAFRWSRRAKALGTISKSAGFDTCPWHR